MPNDNLGLSDTPPSRGQVRLGLVIVGLLFVAVVIILPVHDVRWREVVAFVPAINTAMFVAELIIATLLYSQAVIFRSRALAVLASGYVFIAVLLIPHTLTFPGAIAPDGFLDAGVNSTAWIAIFRRLAFPIAVLSYAWFKHADIARGLGEKRVAIRTGAIVAIVAAVAATVLATAGHDLLPPFFINRTEVIRTNLIIFNLVVISLTVTAIIAVFRGRQSVLDTWLLVALTAWLFQSVLNLPLQARFTVGFYSLFLMMMAATLILLVALVAESSRLYARLALSTSAYKREREARLMSMPALAAAVVQEIGQPLSAVLSNAAAGKAWLTRDQPGHENAIEALDHALVAGRRTFEIMKSVRARFTGQLGGAEEFCVNELVRETALLIERELVARKISLQLDFDDSLPPMRGDRAMIQRVLLKLTADLFQAREGNRGQQRRILLRTAAEERHLILEVRDAHVEHSTEEMEQVFEPFFDAENGDRGLGLSLCRTIVEDHGGYLFALQVPGEGTCFRLKLRASNPLGHQ